MEFLRQSSPEDREDLHQSLSDYDADERTPERNKPNTDGGVTPLEKRPGLMWWIRLVAGILLVVVIAAFVWRQRDQIIRLSDMDFRFFLAVLPLLALRLSLMKHRWGYTLREVGRVQASSRQVWRSLFGSITLGLITPGRIGELVMGIFFPHEDFWNVNSASIIDKGFGHLIAYVIGAITLLVLGLELLPISGATRVIFYVLMGVILALILVFVYDPAIFAKLLKRVSRIFPGKIRQALEPLTRQLTDLNPVQVGALLLMSLAIKLIVYLEMYLLLRTFGPAPFVRGFLAFGAAQMVARTLPLTFANLGIQEGSRILFFNLIGVSSAITLNASLLLFGINVLLPGIVGYRFIPVRKGARKGAEEE
ncbi:MAG: flippase-like domain-containing protein [Candidatus Marinimicrobia bacterium]|nr:flippase-like domain-containing protein [Candidatus Neomarinimicrobiota bacterium]MCF7830271.1 flippase-like domain-containing protein [Candidatus Neomarinimicrobiota bacterium]MCF7882180.1 flippase-like domain-containing protein [Candidatus Neomarinimicrobiota bacterium]